MNAFQNRGGFANLPIVVKNLLIINGLFFLAKIGLQTTGVNLSHIFGAYYFDSPNFEPWQIITHMFMHASMSHIFFNMFALWMFGTAIEQVWGPKKFLIYYLITGFGAFLLHYAVVSVEMYQLASEVGPDVIAQIKSEGVEVWTSGKYYTNPIWQKINAIYNIPVVGASGAVFGLLLAYGMMFPNNRLMLIFLPVPIKAKYFVMGYGAIELFSGIANSEGDNVAHFAHLGGMLFGYLLIKYWDSNKSQGSNKSTGGNNYGGNYSR